MKKIINFLPKLKLKNCLVIILGSFILAFGLYNVHSVAKVTEGGSLGLCLLLDYHFGISPAVTGFTVNVISYVIGFKVLGKDFLGYSAVSTAAFSAFYALCEIFPPIYPEIANYPIIASVTGALFVGVGVGLCVRMGGAPCADDALSMSFSREFKCKIEVIYLVSDLTVLLLSLSYIPVGKIMYSLLTVILSGRIIGFIERFRKQV
ncbi:MAG: YitT family protein [Ruminococcaceae bacterium]|nr:YitT family protein [Oscillospiraceae bacterium]